LFFCTATPLATASADILNVVFYVCRSFLERPKVGPPNTSITIIRSDLKLEAAMMGCTASCLGV
jgi:hypothetical protein